MGTVAPNPYYTPEIAQVCMDTIFLPTIRAMQAEGRPFKGCLYFGLMLTPSGPKVIEYNCRFGDPGDPGGPAPAEERSAGGDAGGGRRSAWPTARWSSPIGTPAAWCWPATAIPRSMRLAFPSQWTTALPAGCTARGSKRSADNIPVTAGGRVLGVAAVGDTLRQAVDEAYRQAAKVHFENAYCRKDIGRRALAAGEEN